MLAINESNSCFVEVEDIDLNRDRINDYALSQFIVYLFVFPR